MSAGWRPPGAPPRSRSTGEELRDGGLDKVEKSHGRWVDRMRELARQIARSRGFVSADDLRDHANKTGDHPHHQNAWGAIFRGAEWELWRYTKSRHATNHARRIGVWKLRS